MNRCDHNKKKFKLCDVVKRGKGGQPQVLGIISAKLSEVAKHRVGLKAWNYHRNPLGNVYRGRRSESREAGIAVLQFLTANWLQLETRRCAMPGTEYLECPDVEYLSRVISRSPEWRGSRLSPGRIHAALNSLAEAGYICRSKQKRERLANGLWISSPKIISFTKKFFLELGGKRLWKLVLDTGKVKMDKIKQRLAKTLLPGENLGRYLASYMAPGDVVSPKQARWLRRIRPPGANQQRPHLPLQTQFQASA